MGPAGFQPRREQARGQRHKDVHHRQHNGQGDQESGDHVVGQEGIELQQRPPQSSGTSKVCGRITNNVTTACFQRGGGKPASASGENQNSLTGLTSVWSPSASIGAASSTSAWRCGESSQRCIASVEQKNAARR